MAAVGHSSLSALSLTLSLNIYHQRLIFQKKSARSVAQFLPNFKHILRKESGIISTYMFMLPSCLCLLRQHVKRIMAKVDILSNTR